jgi:hypothetical protein
MTVVDAFIIIAAAGLGAASCVGALFSTAWQAAGRKKWALLIAGILGGAYLSVGLVYSSDRLRWYGLPLPVLALERVPGGDWVDYESSLGLLTAGPNFVFWLGLALAPISVPHWWKQSGRSLVGRLVAVPFWKTVLAVALASAVICIAIAFGRAFTPKHVIVVRNESAERLTGIGVRCGRTTHYAGVVLPGEERVFQCDERAPGPYGIRRNLEEIGTCDHADNLRDRYLVTLSGSSGQVVSCEPLTQ